MSNRDFLNAVYKDCMIPGNRCIIAFLLGVTVCAFAFGEFLIAAGWLFI
jgi:hypothetical protein